MRYDLIRMAGLAFSFSLAAPFLALAATPNDADFVKQRLLSDGYAIKSLELEIDLKPRHQLSHLFSPVADLAQKWINPELVTMKYYDLRFVTEAGNRYRCVAGVGNNAEWKTESRYVDIEGCAVAIDDDGRLFKSKIVDLGAAGD